MSIHTVTVILSLATVSVFLALVLVGILAYAFWRVLAESREKDATIKALKDALAARPRPVINLYDWRRYERNARHN